MKCIKCGKELSNTMIGDMCSSCYKHIVASNSPELNTDNFLSEKNLLIEIRDLLKDILDEITGG